MSSKLSSVLFPGADTDKHESGCRQLEHKSKQCKLTIAAETKAQEDVDKSNVRFAAQDEQIEPAAGPVDLDDDAVEDLSPEAHEQIRNLAMTLQKSRLQENRMSNFAYEPVSMPASRVQFSPGVFRLMY